MRKPLALIIAPIALLFVVLVIPEISHLREISQNRQYYRVSASYSQPLWALSRAIEDYRKTHYGLVCDDVPTVIAAFPGQFAVFDRDRFARLERAAIKRDVRDYTGTTRGWVVAVLMPKQPGIPADEIRCSYGPDIMGGLMESDAMPPEKAVQRFGQEFVDELYRRDKNPIPIDSAVRRAGGPDDPLPEMKEAPELGDPTTLPAGMVFETREISPFHRALGFTYGAWRDDVTPTGPETCRVAVALMVGHVRACGGGGEYVRLSLTQFANDCPRLRVDGTPSPSVLYLVLRDRSGREASWIYDLRAGLIAPREGATLGKPNIPPKDGGTLDLGHIVQWELHGDLESQKLISFAINQIILLPFNRDLWARLMPTPTSMPEPVRSAFGDVIEEFVADPITSEPVYESYRNFKVAQEDLQAVLMDWFEVGEDQWLHGYTHFEGSDRTGHVILIDGRTIKWMVKPCGLAWLEFPDGKKMYLVKEKLAWPLKR